MRVSLMELAPLVVATQLSACSTELGWDSQESNTPRVYAGFDLSHPDTGPFPSDVFTVEDGTQATGRRVNYPLPDCTARPTDCDDLAVVNTLDGWGLQPRIAVPFSGDVDPTTLDRSSVFLIALSDGCKHHHHHAPGEVIGLDQMIWDPATHTLFAESEDLLDQQRRYAVIVTDAVRDTNGKAVKAPNAFKSKHSVPLWYRRKLEEATDAARELGIKESEIVSASVFTTQTLTDVMERIRDSIKASTPAAADFNLGPSGERTVFPRSQVATVTTQRQVTVSPPTFVAAPVNIAQLGVVPGAVGTLAYGRYSSPDYMVHPADYIPSVGTRSTPPVQATNTIYFTLYLPSGAKPAGGWPIAIMAGGSSTNKHFTATAFAAKMAQRGIATIGINYVGQGFGPLSRLQVTKTDATSIVFPDAGRCDDQNGDNTIGGTEGARAAPPRSWTVAERDATRQTVIDYLQLVRVIQIGMDVDGDSTADIDASRMYFVGASQGSMMATIFLALEPDVHAGVGAFVTGVIPEHLRWQIVRRPELGIALQSRIPSLLNDNGLTAIDGVPVLAPFFNENKPLRDQPLVINDVAGSIEIQEALELAEMVQEVGTSPALWSKYLRLEPLAGNAPKSVMYLNARGDRSSVNPGTTATIRAGDLVDRMVWFRTDLAIAQNPAFPKEPHAFIVQTLSPPADPFVRMLALSSQDSIAAFLESDGATLTAPLPLDLFELPIVGTLPETLNYIP